MTRPARPLLLSLLCALCLGSPGCQLLRQMMNPRPAVLIDTNPSFAQVSNIVNQNAARVVSLQSNSARISAAGMPGSLNANMALRRDRRFRLKADFALTGPEVDLGSNDELFWVWLRRSEPKALYVCRHADYHQSSARAILPVQPEWLIEAFGLASFNRDERHSPPEPVGQNRLRVTSIRQTPLGQMSKVTVIDSRYGDVVEQHLYDANQQLVATALTDDFRKYVLADQSEIYLPHEVQLIFPNSQMSLTVDVGSYEVNTIGAGDEPMWQLPQVAGYPVVNLADPNLNLLPLSGIPPAGAQQQPNMQQPNVQQPGGNQSAPPGAGRPYGTQYGGDGVSPAGYPGGSSSNALPADHWQRATYPGSGGATSAFRPVSATSGVPSDAPPAVPPAMSGSATASDDAHETIVSPPPAHGPQQRVLR